MKFYLYGRFRLLFNGLYKIYTPFCYTDLPRSALSEKLKAKKIHYFAFDS